MPILKRAMRQASCVGGSGRLAWRYVRSVGRHVSHRNETSVFFRLEVSAPTLLPEARGLGVVSKASDVAPGVERVPLASHRRACARRAVRVRIGVRASGLFSRGVSSCVFARARRRVSRAVAPGEALRDATRRLRLCLGALEGSPLAAVPRTLAELRRIEEYWDAQLRAEV